MFFVGIIFYVGVCVLYLLFIVPVMRCVCVPCLQFLMSAFGHGCHSTIAVFPVIIVALYNDVCDQYILGLSKTVMSWYLTWMVVVLISICYPPLVAPLYLHYCVYCKGYL